MRTYPQPLPSALHPDLMHRSHSTGRINALNPSQPVQPSQHGQHESISQSRVSHPSSPNKTSGFALGAQRGCKGGWVRCAPLHPAMRLPGDAAADPTARCHCSQSAVGTQVHFEQFPAKFCLFSSPHHLLVVALRCPPALCHVTYWDCLSGRCPPEVTSLCPIRDADSSYSPLTCTAAAACQHHNLAAPLIVPAPHPQHSKASQQQPVRSVGNQWKLPQL